ncbi:MAG: antibiotic biosynthesis monooxygenase [Ruminococcaceae bacterium]|nr:antibiotic biosynthesis monooxygenase [Oscillospiraceae bacterium]
MYTIYVIFKCLPGKREAFVEKVKTEGILDAVRAEDGCIRYDYYYSEADANELLLVEAWESKQHQQIHIEQPHMAALRALKGDFVESTTLKEFKVIE